MAVLFDCFTDFQAELIDCHSLKILKIISQEMTPDSLAESVSMKNYHQSTNAICSSRMEVAGDLSQFPRDILLHMFSLCTAKEVAQVLSASI